MINPPKGLAGLAAVVVLSPSVTLRVRMMMMTMVSINENFYLKIAYQ